MLQDKMKVNVAFQHDRGWLRNRVLDVGVLPAPWELHHITDKCLLCCLRSSLCDTDNPMMDRDGPVQSVGQLRLARERNHHEPTSQCEAEGGANIALRSR